MQAELFTSEIMKMYGGKKGVENLALKKQITSFFETKKRNNSVDPMLKQWTKNLRQDGIKYDMARKVLELEKRRSTVVNEL